MTPQELPEDNDWWMQLDSELEQYEQYRIHQCNNEVAETLSSAHSDEERALRKAFCSYSQSSTDALSQTSI